MKLSKLLDTRFKSGLQKLIAADVPLKSAFKLKGILQTVNNALKTYDEVRLDAMKKYGVKKEDGTLEVDEQQNVKFDPEQYEKFAKEMQELLDTEVEAAKVSLADLGEKVHISADELSALESILELK
jgi:hypothetical protein